MDYSLTLVYDVESEDLRFERRLSELIIPRHEDLSLFNYFRELQIQAYKPSTLPHSIFFDEWKQCMVKKLQVPELFQEQKSIINQADV